MRKNKIKRKKTKIVKNRDIEEIVEQADKKEKIDTMEQVIENMNKKRENFKESIKVNDKTVKVKSGNKKIEIRAKHFSDRRNAEEIDYEKKLLYIRAMNQLEKSNDENETEIQQFFDDIQRKTD